LVAAVRKSVLNQAADDLQREIHELNFGGTDAFLIAAAVAITRDFAIPTRNRLPCSDPVDFERQLIDGLVVTFMFNAINRIANVYGLQPEWVSFRRAEPTLRTTRALMALGLRLQMPLENDSWDIVEPAYPELTPLLHQFGVSDVAPLWHRLVILPQLVTAIYQLLWVSVHCSDADNGLLDTVMQESLAYQCAADNTAASNQPKSIWSQLFAKPYTVGPSDVAGEIGPAGTTLDVAFRVAMLAGVHKLNGPRTRKLVADTLALRPC
jgi:hypothetical protein